MTHFSTELHSQPQAWRQARQLRAELRAKLPADGARVALLGCGTSLYVSQAVAAFREQRGAGESSAFPGSEVPRTRSWDGLIAISRSGTTTEIIDAVGALPTGSSSLGITARGGSPLGALVTAELELPFADERSVVQTRFATTVLSLLLGAYGWDVERSAAAAERHLQEPLPDWAAHIQQFVFLGRGVGAALANEAALKFRETLATWSEAYTTLEYRHGPIAAAAERTLVWILDAEEPSIDAQIRATGARVLRAAGDPLAELVRVHRFAEGLLELHGINPDNPPHISRSVVLPEQR